MLYGFGSNIKHRRLDLTKKEEARQKGVFYNRIRIINIFGFADQDTITYGLGYNLTLERDTNNSVIYRTAAVAEEKFSNFKK